jgi:hypothetical protein
VSENSSWWLLLPCGIVAVALIVVIVIIVVVVRKVARPALRNGSGRPGRPGGSVHHSGSPLDSTWIPGGSTDHGPAGHHHSGQHWESHGHTIHHHDPGSSWSDSGSSSSSSSSSSDSGSSSSGDSGSSSSSSSSSD